MSHAVTDISVGPSNRPAHSAPQPAPRARRVAIVLDSLRAGGKERVVATLARQLHRDGLGVSVISLHGDNGLTGNLAAAGVDVHLIRSSKRWDLSAIGRLRRLLQRLRPDVINVHDRFSLPYVVAARALIARVPIVMSCHGLLMSSLRPTRAQYLAARRVDAFTAVSLDVAEAYGHFFSSPAAFELTPNGIEPVITDAEAGRNVRGELGIAPDAFVFLAVGAVKPEKGYEDLLTACGQFGNDGQPRAHVVIAGSQADEPYAGQLQQIVDAEGLAAAVHFIGHRDDVEALYSAADAFLLPSRSEGLPLALLEAMSAGLPVVATAVGGVPSVLGTDAGLLIEPNQPQQLAQAMTRLLDDAGLRDGLSQRAAAAVSVDHNAETMAAAYIDIYERLLASQRRDRPGVLILGPQTPMTGGMASVIDDLRRSDLTRSYRLQTLNTGKTTRQGRSFLRGAAAQASLLWRLIRKTFSLRPKLVHIHTCSGMTFWRDCANAATVRLMGRPVVWHIHGGRFVRFAESCGPLGLAVMQRALESAAAVVVLGRQWREQLKSFAPRARFRVVPNGVSLTTTPTARENQTQRFLFMGHLGSEKGAADLIRAVELAAAQGHTLQVDLAGAQRAPGQFDALHEQVAAAGLADSVRFVGVLTGSAKRRALASATALVLPSYIEAMPISILEAMAAGRPVIASDVGSVNEIVTDGVEGFLIDPGDTDSLAAAMIQLAGDPPLTERMAEAARRRVELAFSVEAMARRMQGVYDEVLRARR